MNRTHKIVFELSVANFWGSFFSPFLSTWMVPPDPVQVYGAAGTTATVSPLILRVACALL